MASLFEDRLNNLVMSSRRAGISLKAKARALWYSLSGSEPTDIVDGFDHAAIAAAFDRSQEEVDYEKALTTPSSFKAAQAAKLQNDTLAALERDTRMRHRSRVRMMAHAVAKTTTHGLADGPVSRGILFVNRLKEQVRQ